MCGYESRKLYETLDVVKLVLLEITTIYIHFFDLLLKKR